MDKKQIALDFNQIINKLITTIERKSREDLELANLDRLQKRISLLKQIDGVEALIENAAPVILKYSDQILNNDETFFTTMDVRKETGDIKIKQNDEYIFALIDSVKKHYTSLKEAEKKNIFIEVNKLLNLSAQYAL